MIGVESVCVWMVFEKSGMGWQHKINNSKSNQEDQNIF